MHDELEARIVRALRAEADSLSMTVTPEQIEERLLRSSGVPWLAVAALGLAALLVAFFGVTSPKFAGVGEMPLVTELPAGTWVSNSAFRSGSICLAIEVDDPSAESHSAWWWNPGGSGDCNSRSSSVVQAAAATDEFPLVRVELPSMSEQGTEGQYQTLSLRFTGYTDDGFELHGVRFRQVDDVDEVVWPAASEGPPATSAAARPGNVGEPCAVTRPDPAFAAPPPYPSSPPDERKTWFGTPQLWTMLEADGEVWDAANAAFPIGEKTFWWSSRWAGMREESQPGITVTATRLDGPGSVTTDDATNAADDSLGGEAMLVGIELPTAGCWELTAEYRDAVLSYVVWIKDE